MHHQSHPTCFQKSCCGQCTTARCAFTGTGPALLQDLQHLQPMATRAATALLATSSAWTHSTPSQSYTRLWHHLSPSSHSLPTRQAAALPTGTSLLDSLHLLNPSSGLISSPYPPRAAWTAGQHLPSKPPLGAARHQLLCTARARRTPPGQKLPRS